MGSVDSRLHRRITFEDRPAHLAKALSHSLQIESRGHLPLLALFFVFPHLSDSYTIDGTTGTPCFALGKPTNIVRFALYLAWVAKQQARPTFTDFPLQRIHDLAIGYQQRTAGGPPPLYDW